jgi:hypothetical protein
MSASSLPYLAYANAFAQKSQPFAYSGYVPGRLPARDGYAQRFYCSTFGQNMIVSHLVTYFEYINKFKIC